MLFCPECRSAVSIGATDCAKCGAVFSRGFEPVQGDVAAPVEPGGPPKDEVSDEGSKQTGLPWGFVAAAAAGTFLVMNLEKVRVNGGSIYVIGAVVLGILSANMLSRK